MHVQFNPEDYDTWLSYYGNQAFQTGFGIQGYRGIAYQRGAGLGSFFKSLFRMAVPVIKSIGRKAGKQALYAGADLLTDVAQGKPVIESAKKQLKATTAKVLRDVEGVLQEGEGLGFMEKSINTNVKDVFSKPTIKHVSHRRKIKPKY
jgi:hypothetical protein